MKLEILAILSTYLVAANAQHDYHAIYHRRVHAARDVASAAASSSSVSSAVSSAATASGTASAAAATSAAAVSVSAPAATATGDLSVPPLSELTSGMPSGTSLPLAETFTAGETPSYSGAPALPSTCKFNKALHVHVACSHRMCSHLRTGYMAADGCSSPNELEPSRAVDA